MNKTIEKEALIPFGNLEIRARQVVEGFITGLHKSPFHGFSVEFAEHRLYNPGESTRHIDWKLYGRSEKLFTKKYEEETNLRCQLVVDTSSSMYYNANNNPSKIEFSMLGAASIIELLKKQRDAVGLSVFSDTYEYYAPEKGSDRHHRMILNALEGLLEQPKVLKSTDTITFLHQIAEKIHRRSMILLFTDMFQNDNEEALFNALQHLKHNKHKVVVFHVVDAKTELNFDFDNGPRQFIDVETGEEVAVFADTVQEEYEKMVATYFKKLALTCAQNRIQYVPVAIGENFEKILLTYLVEKQNFG